MSYESTPIYYFLLSYLHHTLLAHDKGLASTVPSILNAAVVACTMCHHACIRTLCHSAGYTILSTSYNQERSEAADDVLYKQLLQVQRAQLLRQRYSSLANNRQNIQQYCYSTRTEAKNMRKNMRVYK